MTERRSRVRRRNRPKPELDTSVPSPCVMVCDIDTDVGLCRGCLRDIDEIREWIIMTRNEKLGVLAKIEQRKKASGK